MATISMLQSAIQIAGDGGARIKLDIDDSGMDAVMALSALRGELLRVTVEPAEQELASNACKHDKLAERKERKSERVPAGFPRA
jgi:hypothetical protein